MTEHGAPSRPFGGFMDGWAVCPDCGAVNQTFYGEPYRCSECGDDQ